MVAPDDLPTVLLDTEKIERVLANLLDNAIKYTPDNEPIILAAELADKHRIVVSVTDAGPGIPPEERERIFERFAQVPGQNDGAARLRAGADLLPVGGGGSRRANLGRTRSRWARQQFYFYPAPLSRPITGFVFWAHRAYNCSRFFRLNAARWRR